MFSLVQRRHRRILCVCVCVCVYHCGRLGGTAHKFIQSQCCTTNHPPYPLPTCCASPAVAAAHILHSIGNGLFIDLHCFQLFPTPAHTRWGGQWRERGGGSPQHMLYIYTPPPYSANVRVEYLKSTFVWYAQMSLHPVTICCTHTHAEYYPQTHIISLLNINLCSTTYTCVCVCVEEDRRNIIS